MTEQQELCIVIYDHETETVLDATNCSIMILTREQADDLVEERLDPETMSVPFGRPVITDAVRFRFDALRAMDTDSPVTS